MRSSVADGVAPMQVAIRREGPALIAALRGDWELERQAAGLEKLVALKADDGGEGA